MECKMSLVCALDRAHSIRDASHLVWFIMEISCTPYGLHLLWFSAPSTSMSSTILSASHTKCRSHTKCEP